MSSRRRLVVDHLFILRKGPRFIAQRLYDLRSDDIVRHREALQVHMGQVLPVDLDEVVQEQKQRVNALVARIQPLQIQQRFTRDVQEQQLVLSVLGLQTETERE